MKRVKKDKVTEFIIVNQSAEVFCGLVSGYPKFTDDWQKAKPLTNEKQFDCVQRGTLDKLEMMSL